MESLIEQVQSLLKSATSNIGKRFAKTTLAYLKEQEILKELTEHEQYAIQVHKDWQKDFPKLQRLWPVTLSAYDYQCPYCKKKIWGRAKFVTVIKETADIDLVLVVCKCGTLFRKFEDKRELEV
jgi:hypothetical protein